MSVTRLAALLFVVAQEDYSTISAMSKPYRVAPTGFITYRSLGTGVMAMGLLFTYFCPAAKQTDDIAYSTGSILGDLVALILLVPMGCLF